MYNDFQSINGVRSRTLRRDEMNVFIVNSAPGAGKTTLMKKMYTGFTRGFAFVDGDEVGRVVPFELSIDLLNLIQDNMVSCAKNFERYGFPNAILSFVLPSEERIGRLKTMIEREGWRFFHVKLFCEDEELRKRITVRNSQRLVDLDSALLYNGRIRALDSDFEIDTTLLTPEETFEKAREIFGKFGGV